jgi:hypothetical protein
MESLKKSLALLILIIKRFISNDDNTIYYREYKAHTLGTKLRKD